MRRLAGSWRIVLIALIGVASLAVVGAVLADSTLRPSLFGGGGGRSSSTHFRLDAAAGQPAPIGIATSTSYRLEAGFFHGVTCVATERSGDPDQDGDVNQDELNQGTDPCRKDTDTDGCADGEETQPNQAQGGDRDPLSIWDFFDVPVPTGAVGADGKPILTPASVRSKAVNLQDVGVVLAYVGRASSNPAYQADNNADGKMDGQQLDRTPSTNMAEPWRSGPPNNAITLQDVGIALAQVGHSCAAAP